MAKLEFQDLSYQVYEALKNMILGGEIKPGEKLRQDELAGRLGVSRTPLLSAFSKLEKELLVEMVPRRGAFVRRFHAEELVHVYDIRIRLEPLGAREAATHGTEQQVSELVDMCERFRALVNSDPENEGIKRQDYAFHMKIMEMSGNNLLFTIISSFNIIAVANVYGFFKDPRVSAAEHQRIVDSIAAQDAERAADEMYIHVNNSRIHLISHLSEFEERYVADY